MKEIEEGIYRIALPTPIPDIKETYSYLLIGENGNILVDAGWRSQESLNNLKENMLKIGSKIESIKEVIITHLHVDHYGLAQEIKEISGANIIVHKKEIESINTLKSKEYRKDLNKSGLNEIDIKQSIKMIDLMEKDIPRNFDEILQVNEEIKTKNNLFEIILTPGHTPGHICLYDKKKKIMISGDHILNNSTPNIPYYPIEENYNPLNDYLESLKSISKLEIKKMLPAHNETFSNVQNRIEQIIKHHSERLEDVINALDYESKNIQEIAIEISWTKRKWNNLDSINKFFAILETISHLEFLRLNNKIQKDFKNERWEYALIKKDR